MYPSFFLIIIILQISRFVAYIYIDQNFPNSSASDGSSLLPFQNLSIAISAIPIESLTDITFVLMSSNKPYPFFDDYPYEKNIVITTLK